MSQTFERKEFLNRSLPFLTENGADYLRHQTVAIAGCGGVGGIAAMTLVRMGVERFRLADPGKFDMPDMNRQIGASTKTLGQMKTGVYETWIKEINPNAQIKVFNEGVQEHNVASFLDGVDVLIDCIDLSVSTDFRRKMFALAHDRKIFCVTAPILGFGAGVACSHPDGESLVRFVKLLDNTQGDGSVPGPLNHIFMPEHMDLVNEWMTEKKTKVPSIAVAPMIASTIVTTETLCFLIGRHIPGGRPPLSWPQIFLVDLFRMNYRIINAGILFKKDKDDEA